MTPNNVKVYIRAKPAFEPVLITTQSAVEIKQPSVEMLNSPSKSFVKHGSKLFTFDKVFSQHERNSDLYSEFGSRVVENAIKGYNACIFAYGQTSSGKTHSMFGNNNDEGLISLVLKGVFNSLQKNMKIYVSFFEIYNERVYDLLTQSAGHCTPSKTLKIREHPSNGIYVEALTRKEVFNFDQISKLIHIGSDRRTVGETALNSQSSRSHAVFTVEVHSAIMFQDQVIHKVGKIHLVDLAGSERVSVSQTSGDRLKEGGMINKSLTTLGLVFKALVERADGKNVFVPYRDSSLTFLLKESLGGNSITIMLATISSEARHLEESVSTLRFAYEAKRIVNGKLEINCSGSKMWENKVQELMEEISKLKAKLNEKLGKEKAPVDESEQVQNLRKQLEDSQRDIEELRRVLDMKLSIDTSRILHFPNSPKSDEGGYFFLIGENERVKLKLGDNTIGSNVDNDVVLRGSDVEGIHCIICVAEKVFLKIPKIKKDDLISKFIENFVEESPSVFVNGEKVIDSIELHQDMRLLVGKHYFVTKIDESKRPVPPSCKNTPIEAFSPESFEENPFEYLTDFNNFNDEESKFISFGDIVTDNKSEKIFRVISNSFTEMETTSINLYVEIPRVELAIDQKGKEFLLYEVVINLITSESIQWRVFRRYSHFLNLHNSIKQTIPPLLKEAFPLPSISSYLSKMDVVSDRKVNLEVYMNGVLSWQMLHWVNAAPEIIDKEYVVSRIPFLNPESWYCKETGMWVFRGNFKPF